MSKKLFNGGKNIMNELKIFNNQEFGEVRTIEEEGKILFCGSDVAKSLGYVKPQNAIDAHCRYTLKRGIPHPQSPERRLEMLFIPEGDLYRLITNSKLQSAERFEKWVFDEVLPSIRKTGIYKMPLSKKEEMRLYYEALEEQDAKIEEVKKDLQEFKQDLPVLGVECDKITFAVKKKGIECLGGKESAAYQDKSLRGKVYSDIHSQVKREFAVTTYKAIKRSQVELAVKIIGEYKVPFALKNEIEQCNNQMFINASA